MKSRCTSLCRRSAYCLGGEQLSCRKPWPILAQTRFSIWPERARHLLVRPHREASPRGRQENKSSLLLRFSEDTFEEDQSPTIGVDFKLKFLNLDGKRLKLLL